MGRRARGLWLVATSALLASCAGNSGSSPGPTQSAALSEVLTVAFEDIEQVYIEPRDLPTLATGGLDGLKRLDSSLSVSYQGSQLT